MKKLIVLVLVLSMATIANAGLQISVGGQINPPDTSITLAPSDTVMIDIHGDNGTVAPTALYLIVDKLSRLDGGGLAGTNAWNMVLSEFTQADAAMIAYLNNLNGYPPGVGASDAIFINALYTDPQANPNYSGLMVDGVVFHCDAVGDVLISLVNIAQQFNEDTGGFDPPVITVFDTQVIHQVPEPMTMVLLGLGGLFLRRNRK